MVEYVLFEKCPVGAFYGLHNMPGIPAGPVALRSGPAMAAFDIFEIVVPGKGAHAAMPQLGIDPALIGPQIAPALPTIASRRTTPLDTAAIGVTHFHAVDIRTVITQTHAIPGTRTQPTGN